MVMENILQNEQNHNSPFTAHAQNDKKCFFTLCIKNLQNFALLSLK